MSAQPWSRSRTLLMVVLTIPFIYPMAFLVYTALKPLSEFNKSSIALPQAPTLHNIESAWTTADLGRAMLNSLSAVSVSVVATVCVCSLGAYWFLLKQGRFARMLRFVIIGTMAVPPPVIILPLFSILNDWNLTNNLIVLGLVYAAWNASFGLYLMYAHLKGLPGEIIEAAQIDGASFFTVFSRVLLPMSRPVLGTLAVLTFVWSWSDLLLAVVLVQAPGSRLLIPATALFADRYNTDTPQLAAGALIALMPMVVVFLIGQRALVRGITAGMGK